MVDRAALRRLVKGIVRELKGVPECADRLGVHRSWIYRAVNYGRTPGRVRREIAERLRDWAENGPTTDRWVGGADAMAIEDSPLWAWDGIKPPDSQRQLRRVAPEYREFSLAFGDTITRAVASRARREAAEQLATWRLRHEGRLHAWLKHWYPKGLRRLGHWSDQFDELWPNDPGAYPLSRSDLRKGAWLAARNRLFDRLSERVTTDEGTELLGQYLARKGVVEEVIESILRAELLIASATGSPVRAALRTVNARRKQLQEAFAGLEPGG